MTSRRLRIAYVALVAMVALAGGAGAPIAGTGSPTAAAGAYRVDATSSRLTVETETVGLSSMFGHDHKFVARDFTGTLILDPRAPESSTLELTVRGDALTLLEEVGEDAHRGIAAALRDVVLETGRYPQITFRSKNVAARKNGDGSFDVRLTGVLDLHGVRRTITVPAHVTLSPNRVRAIGALELRQSDFKIKPYTFARGTVKVRDYVAVSFDLIGKR